MANLSKGQNGGGASISKSGGNGGSSGNGGDGGLWRGVRMSDRGADAIVLSLSLLLFAFIIAALILATK
ncbi:MAG: hypothetical protein IJF38_02285 [Clostridia bacterium]|nr:hypothetical protein [Clostridia bacterium]